NADLETIIHQLNFTLFDTTKGDRFITFFVGEYDFSTRSLRFVNAGHNPPLLLHQEQKKVEYLEAGTTLLGAFETLPFLEIGKRDQLKDFTLHLYTDGLTEAKNPLEEEFGEKRFREFVEKSQFPDPKEFHYEFMKVIRNFSQDTPLQDDLTLLSLRFH
ncbi:MAG: PP2C family protein-serine/threonine phosphatase, partial [Bacteroidota bacterium]